MNIRELEGQSGILRLPLLLLEKGEMGYYSIIKESDLYDRILRNSLDKLKKLGLVKTRIDTSTYPSRIMISLTDKGRRVAEKLKEIEEMLERD